MKLVTSVYNLSDVNNLIDSIDYALVHVKGFSINYDNNQDLDSMLDLLQKNNKNVILSINRIMTNGDFNLLSDFIDKYINTNYMFYVSDLGLVNLLIKKGLEKRTIYNPETMITNYCDLNEFNALGLDAYGISSEITLNDLNLMYEKTNANLFYLVFGHRIMFYSRRHLIDLYAKKNNTSYSGDNMYLRESTRSDFLPIIQNENGTSIYRSYLINLFDRLSTLNIEYAYLESLYVDIDTFKTINECFYDVVVNKKKASLYVDKIKSLNLNTEDGFFYKDSVYQKEELKK